MSESESSPHSEVRHADAPAAGAMGRTARFGPALAFLAYLMLGLSVLAWVEGTRNTIIILAAWLPGLAAVIDHLFAPSRMEQVMHAIGAARKKRVRAARDQGDIDDRFLVQSKHRLFAAPPNSDHSVVASTGYVLIGALVVSVVFSFVGIWSAGCPGQLGHVPLLMHEHADHERDISDACAPEHLRPGTATTSLPHAATSTTATSRSPRASTTPASAACEAAICGIDPVWNTQQYKAGRTGMGLALLGAFVVALYRILLRLNSAAVSGKFLLGTALRACVSAGLGFALGVTPMDLGTTVTGPALFLLVGMFPTWAFGTIQRKARAFFKPPEPGTEPLPLDFIQGLDDGIIERLQEMGSWDVQHLATSRPFELAVRTSYPLPRVLDWIDQALLINYVGKHITAFRDHGVRGAVDFAAVYGDFVSSPEMVSKEPADSREARARMIVTELAGATKLTPEDLLHVGRCLHEDALVDFIWDMWFS